MTAVWADLSTLEVHEHLLHSYSLALRDAIERGALSGFCGEQVTIGALTLTSCVVLKNQAFTEWHAATIREFGALTLPSVATVAALNGLPHFTPSLLLYVQRVRKAAPAGAKKKAGRKARPDGPASTGPEASTSTHAALPERAAS